MGRSARRPPGTQRKARDGTGTVFQRQDGRWEGKLSLPDGRRKSYYGKTEAEAAAKLDRGLRELSRGTTPPSERTTLAHFLDRWLADVIRPNKEPRTYESYAYFVQRHIVPALGHVKLARLTIAQVQALIADKQRAGYAARTVHGVRQTLSTALARAVVEGIVPRNVAALATAPTPKRVPVEALSVDRAKAILAALRGTRLDVLIEVALCLGLRQQEALALRWSDVDLDTGTLVLRRALKRVKDAEHATISLVFGPTKTHRSARSMPIPTPLVAALRRQKAAVAADRLNAGPAWVDHDLIFSTRRGTPLDGRYVTARFQAALARAGLPRMTFTALRHGAISFQIALGVHPKLVAEFAGHTQISTTMDVYGHLFPAATRDAIESVARLLARDDPDEAAGA